MYIIDKNANVGSWDGAFTIFGIGVIFDTLFGWFNLAQTYT